jgi:hypothetical protein
MPSELEKKVGERKKYYQHSSGTSIHNSRAFLSFGFSLRIYKRESEICDRIKDKPLQIMGNDEDCHDCGG